MTRTSASCPNCSAPLTFRWSSAVQTTCAHCRSVVVRHDIDWRAIGEVSDLPQDSSPIQLGTEGRIDDRAFTVVGRIVYAYDDGGWNEWHLAYADGKSGWLSDAQAEYAVTWPATPKAALPKAAALRVGARYTHAGVKFVVATITKARYQGVEGELPFEYWGKDQMVFADMRTQNGDLATVDYSEDPPLFFAGKFVAYDQLALRNVRTFEGW